MSNNSGNDWDDAPVAGTPQPPQPPVASKPIGLPDLPPLPKLLAEVAIPDDDAHDDWEEEKSEEQLTVDMTTGEVLTPPVAAPAFALPKLPPPPPGRTPGAAHTNPAGTPLPAPALPSMTPSVAPTRTPAIPVSAPKGNPIGNDWDDAPTPDPEALAAFLNAPASLEAQIEETGAPEENTGETRKPEKKKRKKNIGGTNLPGGIRLTKRDYEIIAFLARYRLATVGQLAARFGTSETALRNRLPRLEGAGLLSWAYTVVGRPKVWTVTDQAMKTAGLHLPVPTISWGTLRHTLGLVDLGVVFENSGENVVSEREIRAAATRNTPTARMKTAIDLVAALAIVRASQSSTDVDTDGLDSGAIAEQAYVIPIKGRGFGHIPDMVLVRPPFPSGASGSIAVELELNRKSLSEWKTILTAYRDTPLFHQVVYYVVDGDLERAIKGVIAAIGGQEKIQVVRFTPIENAATPMLNGN